MAAGSTHPPVSGVSVEEYLATSYKPACDYLDGVLRQKPLPTWKHSVLQTWIAQLIRIGFPGFEVGSEPTVRLSERRYLVPDLAVQRRDCIQAPYPTDPVHLCVEIVSPDDHMGDVFTKCEEYHAWGVKTAWIVDPDNERAWEYRAGERPHEIPTDGSLTAEGIAIPLAEVFSVFR